MVSLFSIIMVIMLLNIIVISFLKPGPGLAKLPVQLCHIISYVLLFNAPELHQLPNSSGSYLRV